MQLDTEEGETFVPPAGVVASHADPSNGGELPGGQENADSRAGEEPDSSVET
jgi:hypothetical protein